MNSGIILEEVHAGGVKELRRLNSGELILGREPDDGLALGHTAISREHGIIQRVRAHWFYKDFGSTNGSWVNGEKCPPDVWFIIRPRDYIQLADVVLRVVPEDEAAGGQESSSLVIFCDGKQTDEFPLPSFGRALVIGGSESDLDIRGDIYDKPSLVVERRGDKICAYNVAREYPLRKNGEEVVETVDLTDRDRLHVAEYEVVLHDPASAVQQNVTKKVTSDSDGGVSLKSWGDDNATPDLAAGGSAPSPSARPMVNPQFGKAPEESPEDPSFDETAAIDPNYMTSTLGKIDGHPSTRFGVEDHGGYNFSSHEDKIIFFVGFVLLLVLMLLVIWWVLV